MINLFSVDLCVKARKMSIRPPRFNREILASITFEPLNKKDATASSGAASGEPKRNPAPPTSPQHHHEPLPTSRAEDETTQRIIECMKVALAKSITSISLPEKDRPLNPHRDFTISSVMDFVGRDKMKQKMKVDKNIAGGAACCSSCTVKATGTRKSGLRQSSDSDEDGGDEGGVAAAPPVSFTFTDYSPMCYRHIREFFGVDPTAYREVLCQSRWHSIPTPGKSSAQLFFCGQNWVIKTMNSEESAFLRNILHRYYYHVRDNMHTLLPHFVGHHLIEIDGLKQMTFVVMQNVFATPLKIHLKFDLKGSTVNRCASEAEKMKQTCTQKDLDINRPLFLGAARKALLLNQVKRDCEFLRKASIMDYSFLVGIHVLPSTGSRGETANISVPLASSSPPPKDQLQQPTELQWNSTPQLPTDERCFSSDQGGMLSNVDPANPSQREIYYVGIIDILQEYNLWKRSETVVQGLLHDRHQVSSVDPADYATRFVSFISSLVV